MARGVSPTWGTRGTPGVNDANGSTATTAESVRGPQSVGTDCRSVSTRNTSELEEPLAHVIVKQASGSSGTSAHAGRAPRRAPLCQSRGSKTSGTAHIGRAGRPVTPRRWKEEQPMPLDWSRVRCGCSCSGWSSSYWIGRSGGSGSARASRRSPETHSRPWASSRPSIALAVPSISVVEYVAFRLPRGGGPWLSGVRTWP